MASPPGHYLGIATESVHPTATQPSSSAEDDSTISASPESRGDGHGRKRWTRLVDWLRDVHGMDVGEDGLLVECRNSNGTHCSSPSSPVMPIRVRRCRHGLVRRCVMSGACYEADCLKTALNLLQPSTTLFTIPAKAMINTRTLAPLYPAAVCKILTPTQLISLHLSIHAPTPDGESSDPTFGPYISTLPRNFDAHPVSWLRGQDAAACKAALLAMLPPTVCSSLEKAHTRLTEDWSAVSGCFVSVQVLSATIAPKLLQTGNHAPVIARRHGLQVADFSPTDPSAMKKFTWAWLSGMLLALPGLRSALIIFTVNTRCIYYQSHPVLSAPENMAMCPVLDFANHAPSRTHVFPVLPSSIFPLAPGGSKKRGQTLGGDYMFLSSSQYPIEKDEELFLRYGAHANRTLFVEYGFVNMWQQGDCLSGKFSGEVDIQGPLEELFTQRGNMGAWMKGVLEGEGYWGYNSSHITCFHISLIYFFYHQLWF